MIYYDFRERESGVPELLRKLGVEVAEVSLEVGDYIVGKIAVERKTIQDYVTSKTSGHLDRQLYELSYNFEFSYLFVEGYVSSGLMEGGLKRAPYISSLIGSSLKHAPDGMQGQIVTINFETHYDTALALKFLHEKVVKGMLVRLPRMKKKVWNPDEQLVFYVSSLPKIGEKRAKLVLKYFETLKAFTNARRETLQKILGEKIGAEIHALINLKYGG